MTTMPSINLLQLPVESKLQILSYLPVKDMARSRGVCRHFRDLVDIEHNHVMLTKPARERALRRIQDSISKLVCYPAHTRFGDALKNYLAHRGVNIASLWDSSFSRRDFEPFAGRWVFNHPASGLPHWEQQAIVETVADFLLKQHVWLLKQQMSNAQLSRAMRHAKLSEFLSTSATTLPNSEQLQLAVGATWEQIVEQLCDEPVFNPRVHDCEATWLQHWPQFPVTHITPVIYAVRDRAAPCLSGTKAFADALNLPDLRTMDFGYCVPSRATYVLVENLLKSINAGKPISRLQEAAVMEELYVF